MKLIGSAVIRSLVFTFVVTTVLVACKNPLSGKTENREMAPFQKSAVTLVGANSKKTNAVTFQQLSGHLTMNGDVPSAVDVTLQVGSLADTKKK